MFTTAQANNALEIAKGLMTNEQFERFEAAITNQICDIKRGDMVKTPKGIFQCVAVLDNGNYMPNNFIETKSDRMDVFHLFKVTDCELV